MATTNSEFTVANVLKDLGGDEEILATTESVEVRVREFEESRQVFTDYDGNFDRLWLCLKGKLSLQIRGDRHRMKEGDLLRIPRGESHGNVACEANTRVLIIRGNFRTGATEDV